MSFLGDVVGSFASGNPIGMAIGLGSSLLGGVLGNKSQKAANQMNLQIARENNQTSMDIANMNNAFQWRALNANNDFNRRMAIEMFNMENAYNTPLQQVARLREAGINPALYFAGGGASAGTADAATPSAASSGISPSMPSLSTPYMEAVPNVVSGALSALTQLAQISNLNSQTRKQDKETSWIDETAGAQVKKMIAEANLTQAQEYYQDLENTLYDMTFDSRVKEVSQRLLNLNRQYFLYLAQENEADAKATLASMESMLTDTNNKLLEQKAPIILSNIKLEGEAIQEGIKTQKTQQQLNKANANKADAEAKSIRILNEVLPEKYANDITFGQAKSITEILNAGSARNKYELINQLVNAGIHREAAEGIANHREELIKKMKAVE